MKEITFSESLKRTISDETLERFAQQSEFLNKFYRQVIDKENDAVTFLYLAEAIYLNIPLKECVESFEILRNVKGSKLPNTLLEMVEQKFELKIKPRESLVEIPFVQWSHIRYATISLLEKKFGINTDKQQEKEEEK